MEDFGLEIGVPVHKLKLISWIESDALSSPPTPPSTLPSLDFLLIGSKALHLHWQQDLFEKTITTKLSPWKRKIMKNRLDERFKKDSDWDLICMNKKALVNLLRMNVFKEIYLNYNVMEKLDINELDEYNCDSFIDWVEKGGQPKMWHEFSLQLLKFDGTIIEVEYCTHQNHLLNYLDTKVIKPIENHVPLLFSSNQMNLLYTCGLAPLQLLEIIKLSHLFFNIDSNGWLKHVFDLEMIHLIQSFSDTYHSVDLDTAHKSNDLPGLVYYDRLTKRIVKHVKDVDEDFSTCIHRFAINPTDDITKVMRSVSTEMLSSAFKVSLIYRNPSYLGNSDDSLEYISQQVAGNMLSRISHVIDSDKLERMVFETVQAVMEYNADTILFQIIRDNFLEISERAFKMIDHPERFRQLFETKVEMNQFRFSNTPIDFINDEVMDISNLDGSMFCNQYFSIEIILKIISFIPKCEEIVKFSQLDKSWNSIFKSEDVWKYLYFSRWPTPSHYTNIKSNYKVKSWKQQVLNRSKWTRLEMPTVKGFEGLSNVFKARFLGQSDFFKQFITDFYLNTYIVKQKSMDDKQNEYKTLNATLVIYWPRQEPIKFSLEIQIDYAVYRSGDSKCGRREMVICKLYGTNKVEYISKPIAFQSFSCPHDFVGNYYLTTLHPNQYAPLFSTILILGFGKLWTNEVLGYSWY